MTFWVAGAAIVGAGVSYAASSNAAGAAKDAANQSAASAQSATQLQGTIYDQNRADQEPWRNAGGASISKLQQLLGLSGQYGGSSSVNKLGANDVINRSSGDWRPNSELYKYSPEYAKAWDDFSATHQAAYGGNPNDAKGSVFSQNILGDMSGVIDSYNAKQAADAESNQRSIEADPTTGSLLKDFSMADYEADPGYAFRVSEGQKALERSAASRGGLYSGRAAKDLTRFGQDQGSQEYQNAFNRYQSNQTNKFNRLATVAGIGQTANNALASAGTNYANQVGTIGMTNAANQGNAALASGNARSSGYTGIASALGSVNWGSLGSSSAPSTAQQGAADFTNGWNSSNYG